MIYEKTYNDIKVRIENLEMQRKRDVLRLLYLLSLFIMRTRTVGGKDIEMRYSLWLKEHALKALIYYGVTRGLFETYDYAPALSIWGSLTRFINTSNEAERDLAKLINNRLLQRLRLATPTYRYIFAYRLIDDEVEKLLTEMPEDIKRDVEEVFKCPFCGDWKNVYIKFECERHGSEKIIPILYCERCKKRIDKLPEIPERGIDGILHPEDVEYEIEPVSIHEFMEEEYRD